MESAQDVFRRWCKDMFAPSLRDLGFKGSGQNYTLPDEQCWVLLGLQKSTSSTSGGLSFTVNLSVVNKSLWTELRNWQHYWMSAKPTANVHGPGQTSTRLGSVMPAKTDTWWKVTSTTTDADLQALRQQVVDAVREHGVPVLRGLAEQNQDRSVRAAFGAIRRDRPRPTYLK